MFECFLCRREWGRFSPYIFLFSSLSSIYNCWCARGALFDCAFKPEFKFKFRFLLEFRFDDDLFRQINKWHVQSVNLSSCRRAELKISARKSLCNGEIPRARRLRWKSLDAQCSDAVGGQIYGQAAHFVSPKCLPYIRRAYLITLWYCQCILSDPIDTYK